MTTARQREANRRNAKRSTGPRTATGKAIARHNARFHGLAASSSLEPSVNEEIEDLTRAIAGEGATPEYIYLARRVAEAEIYLRRVWRAQLKPLHVKTVTKIYRKSTAPTRKLFDRALKKLSRIENGSISDLCEILQKLGWNGQPVDEPVRLPTVIRVKHREIYIPDRYLRRAFSRRKSAIKALNTLGIEAGRKLDENPENDGEVATTQP